MPQSAETLSRQCVPLRTGTAETVVACRIWNARNAQHDAQDTVPSVEWSQADASPMAAEAATDWGMEEDAAERKAWRRAGVCAVLLAAALAALAYLLPVFKAMA